MTDELWTFIACCAPFVALIVLIIIDTLLERSKLKKARHPYEMPPTEMFPMPELPVKSLSQALEDVFRMGDEWAKYQREVGFEEGRDSVLREIAKMKDSEEFYFTKIKQWLSDRQITQNSTPLAQYGKFMEEALELHEALSRLRLCDQEDLADIRPVVIEELDDALGDVWVTLVSVAASAGRDLRAACEGAYNEIKDRKGHLNAKGVFVKENIAKAILDDYMTGGLPLAES